jgi:hypothetical protein
LAGIARDGRSAYLLLLLFPPLYLLVFYGVNGYLLGREYFGLVAYRRLEERAADELRRASRGHVMLAGGGHHFHADHSHLQPGRADRGNVFAVNQLEAMRKDRSATRA